MSKESEKKATRWHDDRGDLTEAVNSLEQIPPEMLHLIAEAVTEKGQHDFEVEALLKSVKSMGSKKVMALYASKKKRRSYDQDPKTHELVNTFFVLEPRNQDRLARDMLDFTDHVIEYVATCEALDEEPDPRQLQRIRQIFVAHGNEAVAKYLTAIEPEELALTEADLDEDSLAEDPIGQADSTQTHEFLSHGDGDGLKIQSVSDKPVDPPKN